MNKRDKLLESIDTADTMTANGLNYGSTVDRGANFNVLENKVKAVFRVDTLPTGAGNITFQVFSGAATAPTAVIAQSPLYDRTALTLNQLIDVPIPSGVLLRYFRLGVANSAVDTTIVLEGELKPVFG